MQARMRSAFVRPTLLCGSHIVSSNYLNSFLASAYPRKERQQPGPRQDKLGKKDANAFGQDSRLLPLVLWF